MSIDVEKLAHRVAALEQQLAADEGEKDDGDKKEASERETLAAEIEALEHKLQAENGEELPPVTVEDVLVETAAEKTGSDDEDKDDKTASLVDPNGVEEQITQKYLTEVEDLEHGTELATGDSMLDVAPTEYVARLKNASSRLDRVAEYLEKTGRQQMALRIDQIADAIDQRVAKVEGGK